MKGITVAGSLVFDMTPIISAGSQLSLIGGSQAYLDQIEASIGGCVGNTGGALHRLGFPVKLVGKVGNDAFGHMVQDVISGFGCQASIIISNDAATSCSIILLPDDGNRIILHKKGASNQIEADEILASLSLESSILHLGYLFNLGGLWTDGGASLLELLRHVHDKGIAISADTSSIKRGDVDFSYHRTMLEKVLGHCDIFMPSVSDIVPLYPCSSHDDIFNIARYFIECGAAIVLIKNGSGGMFLRTAGLDRLERIPALFHTEYQATLWADREIWMEAPKVEHIISTTGAGDIAVAGFLASFLLDEPLSPEQAVSVSTALAGISLGSRDATSLIPCIDQVLASLSMD